MGVLKSTSRVLLIRKILEHEETIALLHILQVRKSNNIIKEMLFEKHIYCLFIINQKNNQNEKTIFILDGDDLKCVIICTK